MKNIYDLWAFINLHYILIKVYTHTKMCEVLKAVHSKQALCECTA